MKDLCGHDINFIDTNGIITSSINRERVGDYHEIGKAVVTKGKAIEVDVDNSYLGTKRGVNVPVTYHGEIVAAIGISGEPAEVSCYAQMRI